MTAKRHWYEITAKAEDEGEIFIYDDIGASFWGEETVNAKDFNKDLKALGSVKTLHIRINSLGGDVFEAQAIHSQLKRHKAQKLVTIDGIAASAASLVAMAGDSIRMPENTMMMIHNPQGVAIGDQEEMRKTAEILDKVKETLVAVYMKKTGMEEKEINKLLNEETWLTAQEAEEMGFADEVIDPIKIAASFDKTQLEKFKHVPRNVRRLFITNHQEGKSMSTPNQNPTTPEPTTPQGTNTPEAVPAALQTQPPAVDIKAALKKDRERTNKIMNMGLSLGCAQEFLTNLIEEDIELADAYERIHADANSRNFIAKKTIQGVLDQEANPSAGGPGDPEPTTPRTFANEDERLKHQWETEANIQAEFGDFTTYRAYMKNQHRSKVLTGSKSK